MERADAHFVECSPTGDYEITSIEYIPLVPAVPEVIIRTEAYFTTSTDQVYWFDPDWNYLYATFVPDGGNTCTTIEQTADGLYSIIGYGDIGGDSAIAIIDSELNVDEDFFVPDAGWLNGEVVWAVRLNSDESALYASSSAHKLYKFNFSTGAEIWNKDIAWPGTMVLDGDDNIYMMILSGAHLVKKYDSEGNLLATSAGVLSVTDIIYDSDNDVVVCAGSVISTHNINVLDPDDLAVLYSYTDTGTCNSIIKAGDYYYVDKSAGADGYNVIKLDSSLNLIDGVAGPTAVRGMCVDWNGNIAVCNMGPATMGVYVYDTDLTLVGYHDVAGGGGVAYGSPEMARIKYIIEGTPASGGYWEFYTSTGGTVDFSNLIGETVCILADGVVYPSQVVDDNGHIDATAFSTATKVHIGLNYVSKLKPMKPMSQIDMMKKKATCKQMGISVHNTDDSNGRYDGISDTGVRYGVHDDDMKEIDFNDPQWKNKSEVDGLFTGTVAVHVPDGFGVNMPLQIMTDSPLPATVRAMIPKVDVTGA